MEISKVSLFSEINATERLIEAAERAGGYVMDPEIGRIGLYRHP